MSEGRGESAVLGRIEERLGYAFKNRDLLHQALVHRSYFHEADEARHNEPLEFLGDAVLGFLVAERIVRRRPELDEGPMTRLRAELVNTSSLAREAERLGLGEALLLGRGEERTGGRKKASLLADAFEAVVGAMFLDGGIRPVRRFVQHLFAAEIDHAGPGDAGTGRDPKTELQEWLQARSLPLPRYKLIEQRGPDHAREFLVEVQVEGVPKGRGAGTSKKRAEQLAAQEALRELKGGARGSRERKN